MSNLLATVCSRRSLVLRAALLLLLAAPSSSLAGELYTSDFNGKLTGESVPFSGLFQGPRDQNGATIAYVDLLGTAESVSLYNLTDDPSGGIPHVLTPGWLHEVASDGSPEDVGDGWTRFDFRTLKLLVTSVSAGGLPNFQGGGGVYFGATLGSFSAVEGFNQNPMLGNATYWQTPAIVPNGPVPLFRVTWETLDPPYVSPTGDANRDGMVDLTDFGILKTNFGRHVDQWTVADSDGDGIVGATDFSNLKENFGLKSAVAAPEPGTSLLALSSVFCLCVFCASRQRSRRYDLRIQHS